MVDGSVEKESDKVSSEVASAEGFVSLAKPATAAAELQGFHANVAHALEIHAGANCSAITPLDGIDSSLSSIPSTENQTAVPTGCPTLAFQAMMRAWLAPPPN